MSFAQPQTYDDSELQIAARKAGERLRSRRELERSQWNDCYDRLFDAFFAKASIMFARSNFLTDLRPCLASLLEEEMLGLLRYTQCPTVSEDDFKHHSGVGTTSIAKLIEPSNLDRVAVYLESGLNRKLFPWLEDGSIPNPQDVCAAKTAIAALASDQAVKTNMRNSSSRKQESLVREMLIDKLGYSVVPTQSILTMHDFPAPGEVCKGECSIDGVKADVVLGLYDGRIMALECKVSNSEVNSYKRLNHESMDKAAKWIGKFGSNGVVPGVVLEGLFKWTNLRQAQTAGLSIFWSDDLGALAAFVEKTRM